MVVVVNSPPQPLVARARCRLGVALALVVALSTAAGAQSRQLEYQVKAAFLYNFAKYVEWPDDSANVIVVGVLGADQFADVLEKTLVGKTVHDKPLQVKRCAELPDPGQLHILVISASRQPALSETLNALDGASVLTVSEAPDFAARGGMIGFRLEGNKVRFEINSDAVARAGLQISSQLLKLATNVIGTGRETH